MAQPLLSDPKVVRSMVEAARKYTAGVTRPCDFAEIISVYGVAGASTARVGTLSHWEGDTGESKSRRLDSSSFEFLLRKMVTAISAAQMTGEAQCPEEVVEILGCKVVMRVARGMTSYDHLEETCHCLELIVCCTEDVVFSRMAPTVLVWVYKTPVNNALGVVAIELDNDYVKGPDEDNKLRYDSYSPTHNIIRAITTVHVQGQTVLVGGRQIGFVPWEAVGLSEPVGRLTPTVDLGDYSMVSPLTPDIIMLKDIHKYAEVGERANEEHWFDYTHYWHMADTSQGMQSARRTGRRGLDVPLTNCLLLGEAGKEDHVIVTVRSRSLGTLHYVMAYVPRGVLAAGLVTRSHDYANYSSEILAGSFALSLYGEVVGFNKDKRPLVIQTIVSRAIECAMNGVDELVVPVKDTRAGLNIIASLMNRLSMDWRVDVHRALTVHWKSLKLGLAGEIKLIHGYYPGPALFGILDRVQIDDELNIVSGCKCEQQYTKSWHVNKAPGHTWQLYQDEGLSLIGRFLMRGATVFNGNKLNRANVLLPKQLQDDGLLNDDTELYIGPKAYKTVSIIVHARQKELSHTVELMAVCNGAITRYGEVDTVNGERPHGELMAIGGSPPPDGSGVLRMIAQYMHHDQLSIIRTQDTSLKVLIAAYKACKVDVPDGLSRVWKDGVVTRTRSDSRVKPHLDGAQRKLAGIAKALAQGLSIAYQQYARSMLMPVDRLIVHGVARGRISGRTLDRWTSPNLVQNMPELHSLDLGTS